MFLLRLAFMALRKCVVYVEPSLRGVHEVV